jgi:hypothetical protein
MGGGGGKEDGSTSVKSKSLYIEDLVWFGKNPHLDAGPAVVLLQLHLHLVGPGGAQVHRHLQLVLVGLVVEVQIDLVVEAVGVQIDLDGLLDRVHLTGEDVGASAALQHRLCQRSRVEIKKSILSQNLRKKFKFKHLHEKKLFAELPSRD